MILQTSEVDGELYAGEDRMLLRLFDDLDHGCRTLLVMALVVTTEHVAVKIEPRLHGMTGGPHRQISLFFILRSLSGI